MEKERGIALGNAILAARTAAAFYSKNTTRRTWLTNFLRDVMRGDTNRFDKGPYVNLPKVYPFWAASVIDYCMGEMPLEAFREIATSQDRRIKRYYKRTQIGDDGVQVDLDPILTDGTFFNRNQTREVDTAAGEEERRYDTANDGNYIGVARDPLHATTDDVSSIAAVWRQAVEHVAVASKQSYYDTDLKIEFERVYELDTSSGGGVLSTTNFYHKAITTAESVKIITPFGFLNKAAVFGNSPESDSIHYKSYLFGSNLLLIDNSLTNYGILDSSIPPGTDKRHLQRVLDMNDDEIERFISNVVTISGGTVTNCPRYGGKRTNVNKRTKRKRAKLDHRYYRQQQQQQHGQKEDEQVPSHGSTGLEGDVGSDSPYEGSVQFTSFNKLNNSVQFTFNTHNRRNYFTANLFLLKADDFCTNDLVCRRAAVSSLCQCERPTLAWRTCLLVTPINTANIEGNPRVEVTRVVMAAFTAFRSVYLNKKSTEDSRLVVLSAFLGLPLPSYTDIGTRPRRDENINIDVNGRSELAPLCVFHRWLRAHSGSDWIVYSDDSGDRAVLDVLDDYGGRAIIVQRPIFVTGADSTSVGARCLIRYMSYEDSVKKVLRLTKHSLVNGLADSHSASNCAVAYERAPYDYIVFDRARLSGIPTDDATATAREQELVGGPVDLWHALFEAPSCLYIDIGVLAALGFNPVAFSPAYTGGGRTFEHVDPNTGDACTVFCSSLLRVVDERVRRVVNITDKTINETVRSDYEHEEAVEGGPIGIKVLYSETPFDSRLAPNRPNGNTTINAGEENGPVYTTRYRESVHDITAYWPGVCLVKIDFVDPELKHVELAFFAGAADDEQMTLENLHGFSDYCLRERLLPHPIVYTIQSIVLNALYA